MSDMLSHTPTKDPCVILSADGTGATLHNVRPCDTSWPDGVYEIPNADTPPCPEGQTFRPENREQGLEACVADVAETTDAFTVQPLARPIETLPATGIETSIGLAVAVALVAGGSALRRTARR